MTRMIVRLNTHEWWHTKGVCTYIRTVLQHLKPPNDKWRLRPMRLQLQLLPLSSLLLLLWCLYNRTFKQIFVKFFLNSVSLMLCQTQSEWALISLKLSWFRVVCSGVESEMNERPSEQTNQRMSEWVSEWMCMPVGIEMMHVQSKAGKRRNRKHERKHRHRNKHTIDGNSVEQ